MLKKIILVFIVIFISVTCSGDQGFRIFHDSEHKLIYKNSICNPNGEFPQMVIIPFLKRAAQIVPRCNTYPKHKTALAMMVFYQQWVDHFGDDHGLVKEMLEDTVIEWDLKKKKFKKAYSLYGEKKENINIIGLAKPGNYIWVWAAYGKISETSLMHELVHQALRATTGSGDPDHEGDIYSGWTWEHTSMINKAKKTLRAFNI
tara:strand:+ start:789 stop:1397 length:609 start_codon:yes stop_codon:yes gene_type:complete